jgi:hypothetical protein
MKHIFFILLLPFLAYSQTSSTICEGSDWPELTAACSGGTSPYTVKWVRPGGDTLTGATQTLDTIGLWSWSCTDSGTTTCASSGGTHMVIVEAEPTFTINADTVCTNTIQPISATGVPSGYTYSWNFGSGASPATGTAATTNVTYSTGGTKTITLTITKNFPSGHICSENCVWVVTKDINVDSLTGTISCN